MNRDWIFPNGYPDGFGTGDCLIIADNILQIIDFKYGLGILVEAENNPQMMCYALGALDTYDGIYDIESAEMTIFQPRRENVSTYTISKEDLLAWAEGFLKPTAELAYNGEGEFHAGDHYQFCKVKATCRKRAEYNMELAAYDFEQPATLDDTEIASILPRIDNLVAWAGDIKEYALQQAMSGTEYPGFKVVEGRSIRKYTDENAIASAVTDARYDPYEKKLLGITAMTSLLGKKKFEELLAVFITKPPGKPTLVPESDSKRIPLMTDGSRCLTAFFTARSTPHQNRTIFGFADRQESTSGCSSSSESPISIAPIDFNAPTEPPYPRASSAILPFCLSSAFCPCFSTGTPNIAEAEAQ